MAKGTGAEVRADIPRYDTIATEVAPERLPITWHLARSINARADCSCRAYRVVRSTMKGSAADMPTTLPQYAARVRSASRLRGCGSGRSSLS